MLLLHTDSAMLCQEVEDGAKSYDVALPVMEGTSVFTVRLMALDDQSQVVARSEEVTMGEAAANACVGTAGIPEEVRCSRRSLESSTSLIRHFR